MKCPHCQVEGECYAAGEASGGLCEAASRRDDYREIVRRLSAGEITPNPPVYLDGDPLAIVQAPESARLAGDAPAPKPPGGCGCGCGGC